ncbi:MAG: hypothetical protein LBD58_01815 [Treponema sp.]|jgi:hypothetical protein|nr:hypothetical protein [Treponema sp.]
MKLLRKISFLSITLLLSLMGCDYEANRTIFVNKEKVAFTQSTSLFLVPVHREYLIDSTFAKTEEHLSAFLVYVNGNTWKAPLSETEIMLEEHLLLSEDDIHYFESAGEKTVAVSYGDLSAQYTIVVRSSGEDPGLTPTTSSDGTSIGIEIIWK